VPGFGKDRARIGAPTVANKHEFNETGETPWQKVNNSVALACAVR
jgi:hypothetical protein